VFKPTVTDADLARLKDERDQADRLYNDGLTALDRALTRPPALPVAAAPPDTSQLERLHRLWQVLPPEPVPFTGWRGRLGAFVWRLIGPMLQRQQEFNAAVVDHAVRTATSASETAASVGELSSAVAVELQALVRLQSRLIGYLQQVTLYVDTRDRFEAGLIWHELRGRTEGLAAGLSALGDEFLKRREHGLARDARLESRIAEVRERVAAFERGGSAAARTPRLEAEPSPARPGEGPAAEASAAVAQLAEPGVSATYAGFEDLYRGAQDDIQDRLSEYLPLFESTGGRIVDLGCGRGEFLEALRERGVPASGVDLNPAMVQRCRERGLDVAEGEALAYLAGVPDASLGGVLAAQVVEHLEPDRLVRLIDLALAKLAPGGRLVLETVNPACWAAFFSSYIRDITHVRPIHPDTLRYLLVARGFGDVDVRFSSPYPVEAKLHALPLTLLAQGEAIGEVVRTFNENADTLNRLMFTHMDYAAVGVKPL
jgi:SAM-dependent methyltransferase